MTSIISFFQNRKDILGMNDRNYSYKISDSKKIRIADNKLLTKKILKKSDIPTPELYGVIRSREQLEAFDFEKLPKSFVLKPARGLKGAGINIYYNRGKDGRWILADRKKHSIDDLKTHIGNILDGQYSIGVTPKPSAAIFEERVKIHNSFRLYSYRGIPDIRVIVYKGIPVMAMLRLSTHESGGKANISLGAIGVGIDMATGVTTTAIKNNFLIENAPGTNLKLSGIRIPYWTKILRMSNRCSSASGINYLGVDVIIDKEKGPLIVELNARPGLGIQSANQAGLKERLLRVKKLKNITEDRAVRLAKDLFGGEIEEEIEEISGREVIGLKESVIFKGKNDEEIKVDCKIDTGAESSSIDEKIAELLGYSDAVSEFKKNITNEIIDLNKEDRKKIIKKMNIHKDISALVPIKSASGSDYRIKLVIPAKIGEKNFLMRATIADRTNLTYPVIIGKKDLREFLIDPRK